MLALLPLLRKALAARFSCPYVVKKRIGDLKYQVASLDRRKDFQLYHITIQNPYYRPSDLERGWLMSPPG